ncbi:MAG: hypothetical protein ACTHK7_20535, partial [Aureliella sp.]
SDPFEQQNPLPNRELLARVASLSGGKVLERPDDLARILSDREVMQGPPHRDITPAWSRFWLWCCLLGCITAEWILRRTKGFA